MRNHLFLKTIEEKDLRIIWEISFGPKADLVWMKFNGPYFNDPVQTWVEFSNGYGKSLINNSMSKAIVVDEKIIGLVTAYWEDANLKQWLDVGILIYDSNVWGHGIGSKALSLWLKELFAQFAYLPHIGFTTWSGNQGMQKIGEKCGMKKEAVIRKVRFLNGQYYDSIKYGILREELIH
ncbi:GNAT family acetyltransferase [Enterococcus sp. JM4C]|uniref:GNAT family N-acetyltransferase n=1 Tax=Candidatus Enterococcus huntleyi TaxID=1857217 RepID=UPI00137A0604|nr:GNAT family protein [Enterococcus sp. JM4C]KAF1296757.1 GNAT family acetyltransferase [Enterococcus sp. JM4C]